MSHVDRRTFVKAAALGAAAAAVTGLSSSASAADTSSKPIKKAVKLGMVRVEGTTTDKFKLLKRLGYDGVELTPRGLSDDEVADVLRARDEAELPVHGVLSPNHWQQPLSNPDPAVREAGRAGLERAVRVAHQLGATSVLLVPAVVNKQVSYADAYTRSQAEIRKVLPLAEELNIRVLIENVWNNFLLSPLEMCRYLDEFESPMMGSYFDVGNVVVYGWPEQWIRTLGPRIVKLDIKEFSREVANAEGMRKGFRVELGEGDCDWPAVMQALRDINYTGWGTAEVAGGDEARLRDIAERMDRCFAA